jgi:hypothetical protein
MQELLNGVLLDPSKLVLIGHYPRGARSRRESPSALTSVRKILGLIKR